MTQPVDLYDSHYERLGDEVYRAIRAETYGVDLGQESWITAEECDRFGEWLGLRAGQRVLEMACGSGGVSARIAERTGAAVVGVDINAFAIDAARKRVRPQTGGGRLEFLTVDADKPLPFADEAFDAVFCNDAMNHFRDRHLVLREWRRVLRAGGRFLYTDPVVVTGLVTNAELEARSSIGFYLFSAPGANEAALKAAGLRVERAVDLTDAVAQTSGRWREARQRHRTELVRIETEPKFEGLQRFLAAVHGLSASRRLSRFAYLGTRGAAGT